MLSPSNQKQNNLRILEISCVFCEEVLLKTWAILPTTKRTDLDIQTFLYHQKGPE